MKNYQWRLISYVEEPYIMSNSSSRCPWWLKPASKGQIVMMSFIVDECWDTLVSRHPHSIDGIECWLSDIIVNPGLL